MRYQGEPKSLKRARLKRQMHDYIDRLIDMDYSVLVGGQNGGYSYFYHGRKTSIVSFATKIIKLYNEGRL